MRKKDRPIRHPGLSCKQRIPLRVCRIPMRINLVLLVIGLILSAQTEAATCVAEDYQARVSGESECLLMRRYGADQPETMLVWLHGNVSTGGPANSHFKLAEAAAKEFAANRVISVALVRPGYPDGTGEYSSGSDNGRADNWHQQTVKEIGTVIIRLKKHFNPRTTILIGHSGGAAISAVLLGMQPELADSVILIGCPCDMITWRIGRSRTPWLSEDPLAWINQVKPTARVIAITGSQDQTTPPQLVKTYIHRLQERGVDASFILVPEAGHIDILRSQAITDAISRFLSIAAN